MGEVICVVIGIVVGIGIGVRWSAPSTRIPLTSEEIDRRFEEALKDD